MMSEMIDAQIDPCDPNSDEARLLHQCVTDVITKHDLLNKWAAYALAGQIVARLFIDGYRVIAPDKF